MAQGPIVTRCRRGECSGRQGAMAKRAPSIADLFRLASLATLAAAAVYAEEPPAKADAMPDAGWPQEFSVSSSLPNLGLPGSTGDFAAGRSPQVGRIGVAPPPKPAGVKDLPTWLFEGLGLKKPKAAGTGDAEEKSHVTIVPFISSSPVTGVGFGVAGAGTAQLGDKSDTSLSTWNSSLTLTTEKQYAFTIRHDVRLSG